MSGGRVQNAAEVENLRTFFFALTGLVAGYVLAAVACYFAVMAFSSNTHDRVLEAQMTAAFAGGPIGAVIGAIAAWRSARRK